MKHAEMTYLLPDFVNNMLSGDELTMVNEHLATCSDCRREVEELKSLMSGLQHEITAAPSPQYWSSVLPRIHERIERKQEQRLPEWLVQFALPISAVVVLIVGIVHLKLPANDNDFAEVQAIAKQLTADELRQAAETVTTPGFQESSSEEKDESASASDDKDMLKEFLQNDSDLTAHTDINFEATAEKLNAHDTDDLIAALEQNVTEK